jgi:hypothetical protein
MHQRPDSGLTAHNELYGTGRAGKSIGSSLLVFEVDSCHYFLKLTSDLSVGANPSGRASLPAEQIP